MVETRKSWADRQGIKTGVIGEIVDDIRIAEENRVTVFEFRREGIQVLQTILRENYKRKQTKAVLFGIPTGLLDPPFKYAIYVDDAFINSVNEAVIRYVEEHGEYYRETIH